VRSESEEVRLRPFGEPEINPEFAQSWVGKEEAEHLHNTYSPAWVAGHHDIMARDITVLLRDAFALHCVDELRPTELNPVIDVSMPLSGARNTAVMMTVQAAVAVGNLLKDLTEIKDKYSNGDTLKGTALGAFADIDNPPPDAALELPIVALSAVNSAQRNILTSAMTRPLTVATGPPGTGKSALVVNVVATAIAAGRSVLVASTYNRAVDEVCERCNRAVPGMIVRTGSSSGEFDYREVERKTLRELISLDGPASNVATWRARHGIALREGAATDALLVQQAQIEADLLTLGGDRASAREALAESATAVSQYVGQSPDVGLERIRTRADSAARAKIFGGLRRRRFLAHTGLDAVPGREDARQLCAAICTFVATEAEWRRLAKAPQSDDSRLTELLAEGEAKSVAAGVGLIDALVKEAVVRVGANSAVCWTPSCRTTGTGSCAAKHCVPHPRGR
jgi:hypothetical protein